MNNVYIINRDLYVFNFVLFICFLHWIQFNVFNLGGLTRFCTDIF